MKKNKTEKDFAKHLEMIFENPQYCAELFKRLGYAEYKKWWMNLDLP